MSSLLGQRPSAARGAALAILLIIPADGRPCTEKECQYLGNGYNIIAGDPHAHSSDPGWAADILSSSWIVDNGEAHDANVCTFDSVTSTISGGKSAQASLKKDTKISASVGLFGVASIAYTGSDSLNEMNKSSWDYSMHHVDARAACEIMFATIPPPFRRYNFTDDFVAAVHGLPNASSPEADAYLATWMGFYGTHYASGVTMGGQMVLRWSISSRSYTNLTQYAESTGHTVDAGAKGSFWIFSDPKGSYTHQSDKEATDAFQHATKGEAADELYMGGAPFVKDDYGAWAAGLKSALAPVAGPHNELTPITALLTPINFPELALKIDGIKKTAEDFLARLCTVRGTNLGYAACTPTPADPLTIPERSIKTGSAIYAVTWARDGGNVTTGDAGGYVRSWDVLTGACTQTLMGHTDVVFSVAYAPDGKHLASGSRDKTVKIWDATTGACTQTLTGHTYSVYSVAYAPDGKHLASGSVDKTVKIWDATTGACTQTLTGHTDAVRSVAYAPDGKHLASGSDDKTVKIWDATTGACTQTLTGHTDWVGSVAYAPDGKHLASGSVDKTVKI